MRTLICILVLFALAHSRADQTNILQNTVSGRTYYHMLFTLTPTNSSLTVPPTYKNPTYRTEDVATFDQSGLFETYVRVSDFPVPAPGCNGGWIVLRMAATGYDASDFATKVAAKKELWDRLQKMYTTKSGAVEVAVELNPYVRVVDAAASKVELEYCNVFFRQAHGAYVPYIGPLRLANKTLQRRAAP